MGNGKVRVGGALSFPWTTGIWSVCHKKSFMFIE